MEIAGPMGNATIADVLDGKTFSSDAATGLIGTMPNRGGMNYTPKAAAQSIFYWSSTTNADQEKSAWIVFLDSGTVSRSAAKDNNIFVWPVRGGHMIMCENFLPDQLNRYLTSSICCGGRNF